jgi:hypothetical protein
MTKEQAVDVLMNPSASEIELAQALLILEDELPNNCPECGEYRPDDERVKMGMKCGHCAYGDLGEDNESTLLLDGQDDGSGLDPHQR